MAVFFLLDAMDEKWDVTGGTGRCSLLDGVVQSVVLCVTGFVVCGTMQLSPDDVFHHLRKRERRHFISVTQGKTNDKKRKGTNEKTGL